LKKGHGAKGSRDVVKLGFKSVEVGKDWLEKGILTSTVGGAYIRTVKNRGCDTNMDKGTKLGGENGAPFKRRLLKVWI